MTKCANPRCDGKEAYTVTYLEPTDLCKKCNAARKRYKLTQAEYFKVVSNTNCGICEQFLVRPVIDHDHVTGEVRGLLCYSCNTALGHFNDSIPTLRNAINYLRLGGTQL